MQWSTVRINKLFPELTATFLRKAVKLVLLSSLAKPLNDLHDRLLYKMQHDGRTIYLEKMLNEYFNISGYDHQNHEETKKIFIEDLRMAEKIFIHQNDEEEVIFLEDADDENDIFIDVDGDVNYSWIINMPNNIEFDENILRTLVDSYRYIGKIYTIKIYNV